MSQLFRSGVRSSNEKTLLLLGLTANKFTRRIHGFGQAGGGRGTGVEPSPRKPAQWKVVQRTRVLGKAQFLGSRSGRALLDRLGEGVRDRVLVSVFAKAETPKRGCRGRSQRSQTDPGSPFSSICKALRRGAHVGGATSKSIVCRRPV